MVFRQWMNPFLSDYLFICFIWSRLTPTPFDWYSQYQPNKARLNICPAIHTSVHKPFFWFQWHLACKQRSMSDTWMYAVWPGPRSRSRRSESCKNGRFHSFISFASMQVIKSLTVNYDTPRVPRRYLNLTVLVFDIRPHSASRGLWK